MRAAGLSRAWVGALLTLLLSVVPSAADLRREVEPNDPSADAQVIVPPFSAGGLIGSAGDVDLYAVAGDSGQILTADILARGFRAGAQPGSQLSAVLEIRDSDGITVLAQEQSAGDFDDPAVSLELPVSGKYFVAVRDLSPAEGGSGHRYVLSVELESNDTFSEAVPVRPPVLPSIDALINPPGDRDFYRLDGIAGQVLTLDVDSAVFNPTVPPLKVVLSLFDPSQSLLAEDIYTDADGDPFLQVTLPTAGTYYVQVRDFRSFVGTKNSFYQLSMELGPAAGNDAFAEGMPVTLPRPVSGVVSTASDVDHYRFNLAAPTTLRADLDAVENLQSLLGGTLQLHDAGGVLFSDSSVPDPDLAAPLAAGDYSVSVEGPCSGGGCENEDSYYVLYLDHDADGDGLVLPQDNCPLADNPLQLDGDGD
ncbi:MAG: PPC domain-containing protein, partial [Gemmatimonadetes bacterium]|nr:PPC domain-containing protein [Gemmatimonadota bacterium]